MGWTARCGLGFVLVAAMAGCSDYEDAPDGPATEPEAVGVVEQELVTLSGDAHVDSTQPTTPLGTSSTLRVSSTERTYLKFQLSGLNDTVTDAKLRLYVTDGTGAGALVAAHMAANDVWTEAAITWDTQPGASPNYVGPKMDEKSVPSGMYVDWNVTRQVSGDGIYTFVLVGTSSTDPMIAVSRDDTVNLNHPQLVVTTASPVQQNLITSGTTDTTIKSVVPDSNYGPTATADVVWWVPYDFKTALLKFNLSGIPATRKISSARIRLRVTEASDYTFNAYEVERAWVENEATWNRWKTGSNWETAGALGNLDIDKMSVGTISPGSTGYNYLTLNAAGIEMVERWIANPTQNNGISIRTSTSGADAFTFYTSEVGLPAYRPRLEVDVYDACGTTWVDDESSKPAPTEIGFPTGTGGYYDETFGTKIIRVTAAPDVSHHAYSYWSSFNKDNTIFLINKNGAYTFYSFTKETEAITDLGVTLPCDAESATWSHLYSDMIYCRAYGPARAIRKYRVTTSPPAVTLQQAFATSPPGGWLSSEYELAQLFVSDDDDVFSFHSKTGTDPASTVRAFAFRKSTNSFLMANDYFSGTDGRWCLDEVELDKGGRFAEVIYAPDTDNDSNGIPDNNCEVNTNRDLIKLSENEVVRRYVWSPTDKGGSHWAPGRGHSWGDDAWALPGLGLAQRDYYSSTFAVSAGLQIDYEHNGMHMSHSADDQRWFAFSIYNNVDAFGELDPAWRGLEEEIIATDGAEPGWVRRLAHHHHTPGDGEYYNTPRFSLSYDGKYGMFSSNFGGTRSAYIVRMPALCN